MYKNWFEDDSFWEVMSPSLFTEDQWHKASGRVDSVVKLLKLPPAGSVLYHCCGPGRHSLEFARRGYNVTGVDRTSRYIEEAKRRARAEGLFVDFVLSDIRDYSQPGRFDAAVNLFTSFGYFEDAEDDKKVVRNLYESLKPGGRLLIEAMGKEILARIFRERDWHREDDGSYLLQERKILQNWSWIENKWTLIKEGQAFELEFAYRPYSATEMTNLLLEAGFKSVTIFGHLSEIPYDHEAKRLVAIALK